MPYEQYISQQALGAYITSMLQPEAAFDLFHAAQTTKFERSDFNTLNKRLKWQSENVTHKLQFVKVDIKTTKLMVFTNAFFVRNWDFFFQISYVIVLVDDDNNANILY